MIKNPLINYFEFDKHYAIILEYVLPENATERCSRSSESTFPTEVFSSLYLLSYFQYCFFVCVVRPFDIHTLSKTGDIPIVQVKNSC